MKRGFSILAVIAIALIDQTQNIAATLNTTPNPNPYDSDRLAQQEATTLSLHSLEAMQTTKDLAVSITSTRTFNNGVWEVAFVIHYSNLGTIPVNNAEVALTITDDDPALAYHSSSVTGPLTNLTHVSSNVHIWSGDLDVDKQGQITVLFKSLPGQAPEFGPYFAAEVRITNDGDLDPSNNIDWIVFQPNGLH